MISLDADFPAITELPIFLHSDNMAVCGSERHERVLCQQTQTYITIGWVLYY